ncbi:hypothetical protein FA10DRAFT_263037 [Acaromyces ingoldii]|uniref:Transcription factor domain-containing protein n=1 Tax=Acaromyces ingoldii TaxID=215250 RepID=A0A316YB29_9BASI|nr:hypothetical protein FA10DRAFT_263037 [Acaromyces ingoldii]PWN86767.1 hypothetical protein FA10DRAFT_263037 [Acaromyces ingoldii]
MAGADNAARSLVDENEAHTNEPTTNNHRSFITEQRHHEVDDPCATPSWASASAASQSVGSSRGTHPSHSLVSGLEIDLEHEASSGLETRSQDLPEAASTYPLSETVFANVFWDMLRSSLGDGANDLGSTGLEMTNQSESTAMAALETSSPGICAPLLSVQDIERATPTLRSSRCVTPWELREVDEAPNMILSRMQRDIHALVRRIKPPEAPSKALADACLWLCQRFFFSHAHYPVKSEPLRHYASRPSMLMNLIAIGSLWNADERVYDHGRQLWLFTVRAASSRGTCLSLDDASVADLMSLLYVGHSYVLLSGDAMVHSLGRRAWISTHRMLEERLSVVPADPPSLDDLLAMSAESLDEAWHKWQREEESIRTTIGLCAYDSQQSLSMFRTPSPLTVLLQTRLPMPDELLAAASAQSWLTTYARFFPSFQRLCTPPCFGPLLLELHRCDNGLFRFEEHIERMAWPGIPLSEQILATLLEAIHVAWRLETDSNGKTSDFNSTSSLARSEDGPSCRTTVALRRWANLVKRVPKASSDKRFFLTERWHGIHLNMSFSGSRTVALLRSLPQRVRDSRPRYRGDADYPARTSIAAFRQELLPSRTVRQALYHAGCILARFTQLSRSASYPTYVVQGAFESAMFVVLCCLALQGMALSTSPFEIANLGSSSELEVLCSKHVAVGEEPCSTCGERQSSTPYGDRAASWINDGDVKQACFQGLALVENGHLILQLILDLLDSSKPKWCYALDCTDLLQSCQEHI